MPKLNSFHRESRNYRGDFNLISDASYNELIGQIYDAPLSGDWTAVLTTIMEVLSANKAFFFVQDLSEQTPVLVNMQCNFEYPPQALLEYQARPFDDPLYPVTKNITQGDALNINNFMDIQKHEGSEYWDSVLVPMRSYYAMAGILKRDGKHESPFAVARWKDQAPFNADELALMKKLTTHMSRAMGIYIDLQMYRKQTSVISELLDSQDCAQFVCDASADILYNNPKAPEYLSEYPDIFSLDGTLTLLQSAFDKQLKTLISQCATLALGEIETQESMIIQADSRQNALITVSPFRMKTATPAEYCLVTIKLRRAHDIEQIQRTFSLTEAEVNLVKHLFSMRKLSDLAKQMGKSHQTLRNQMQSIYKKCDVDSQIALMAKLALF